MSLTFDIRVYSSSHARPTVACHSYCTKIGKEPQSLRVRVALYNGTCSSQMAAQPSNDTVDCYDEALGTLP